MVVGGPPAASAPGGPSLPEGDRDLVGARRRVADRIGELVPFALEHGMRLVLEPLHFTPPSCSHLWQSTGRTPDACVGPGTPDDSALIHHDLKHLPVFALIGGIRQMVYSLKMSWLNDLPRPTQ